ncbi:MAG: hypothetical protein QOJ04_5160, partial [Caballeronia sp.]|nr:hypothetical protein [Caballeronia sp.]
VSPLAMTGWPITSWLLYVLRQPSATGYESGPFCNGPVDVNCPRDRHAAELMLLSVVDAEAATLCC